jgi:hypothetical protein
LEFFGYLT